MSRRKRKLEMKRRIMLYRQLVHAILTGKLDIAMSGMSLTTKEVAYKFQEDMQNNFNRAAVEIFKTYYDYKKKHPYQTERWSAFTEMKDQRFREYMFMLDKHGFPDLEKLKFFMTKKLGDACSNETQFNRNSWLIGNVGIPDVDKLRAVTASLKTA